MADETTAKGRHKKEIYDYDSPHLVYGMAWSYRKDHSFRLALGSFVEEYANQVEIVELVQDDATEDWKFERTASFEHPYPTTKIMWRPDEQATEKDQLATTGDYLRLWEVGEGSVVEKAVFNNVSRGRCVGVTMLVLLFALASCTRFFVISKTSGGETLLILVLNILCSLCCTCSLAHVSAFLFFTLSSALFPGVEQRYGILCSFNFF